MLVASFILRKPGGRQSKHLNACRRAMEVLVLLLAQVGVFCLPSSAQGHSEIPKSIAKFAQRYILKSPKVDCEIRTTYVFTYVCLLPPGLRMQFQFFPIVVWLVWPPFPCSGGHHQRSGRCLAVEVRRVHRQPGLPQVEGPAAAGRVSNVCLTS